MTKVSTGITEKLVSNIFGSTLYKGIDVLFNFLLVRFAIQFFGEEDYGVWLTVLSVFTWFSVIEFGVSSSFRNRMTQFFADKKIAVLKEWIGKGYKATTIIYTTAIILFLVTLIFINSPFETYGEDFKLVFQLSFVLYMIHYIFFFLQTVLLATHHTKSIYLISALQKAILLIGILMFMYFELTPSLIFICLWFSSIPLLVWTFASLFSYNKFLVELKPDLKKSFQQKTKVLNEVKRAFFIIQISTLIVYSTDNLIIINQLSGAEVTNYNIAFKYFNILIIIFNIVLLPYWSSFTEAVHRKDINWITKNVKRLMFFWGGMVLLGIIMLFLSSFAYDLWIGKETTISFQLSIFMGISVLITCWNNIFSYFLNSISKTNWQMYLLVVAALVNIPLSFLLMSYYNSTGVIIATTIVLLPLSIALPFQYRSIVKNLSS